MLPKRKYFYSTDMITFSGDNSEAIYNPGEIIYDGDDFRLYAGETIMIIPLQPNGLGPWKSFRTSLYNNKFVKQKSCKYFCILLSNKWIFKSVLVNRGCRLDGLLAHPGIQHTMGFLTPHDLSTIRLHLNKEKEQDEDEEDEEDEDEDVEDGNASVPPNDQEPIQPVPRLTSNICQRCCHNVNILRA